MATIIRFAAPADAPAVHELIRALAEYEREPEAVEVTPEILRVQLESERPPFECLLAERDDVAVGFALYFQNYSTWTGRPGIYLEDLFVRDSERGQGTGAALLRRLGEIAVERGCGRFEFAVLDWNEPAIGFYRRLGAVPMDEWTVFRFAGEALAQLARS